MWGLKTMSHNENLDTEYTMGKNTEDIGRGI